MELLFALELLFIIRPGAPDHGAAGAPLLVLLIIRLLFIITALQMALLVCLVPALALELLFELLFMELLFIIRPGAAGAPDHSAAVYHSPSSCCL